ncbi:MAG: DUF1684 domain-containing protein [Anaerolineae bacterium]|nr:DUF1684 domain-containing protein [Anaerolineae bacterium]
MLDLLDYRRRVAEMYRAVRAANDDSAACITFRHQRDDLFRTHPQSALDAAQRAAFNGLPYFAHDPAYRVEAEIDTHVEPQVFEVELGEDGRLAYRRFARVHFTLPTGSGTLTLFWLLGYGGGLFLPFGDRTNSDMTYGGGRYLYDTIKGADLGTTAHTVMLDFNYAYNPSCAYHPRWTCPLSPPENRLDFPVLAGEKQVHH